MVNGGVGHCSRWYASYWNAFLFPIKFQNLCIRGLGLKVDNFWISADDRIETIGTRHFSWSN